MTDESTEPEQSAVPEGEEALHVFADAAMILAEQAKNLAGRMDETSQAQRAQIEEVLVQQRTFEADRKKASKRSVLQVIGALAAGLVLLLVVVVSAAVILSNQNRTAGEQRRSLTNVLGVLVDCTTPTPPPTPKVPHPTPHPCYERGVSSQAVAIRQLQLGTLYASECASRNLADGPLLRCVNEGLASVGLPPIVP